MIVFKKNPIQAASALRNECHMLNIMPSWLDVDSSSIVQTFGCRLAAHLARQDD